MVGVPGPGQAGRRNQGRPVVEDLRPHGADAAFIVSKGRERYEEASLEGRLLRTLPSGS